MRSSIPPGILPAAKYPVWIVVSPRFGRIYYVGNVPGRDSILMHGGNVAGDVEKGLLSHVLGCILLGLERGHVNGQQAVLVSRPAVTKLQTEMKELPFTLEIVPWTSEQS
jgi:hypothetical protein